MTLWRGELGGVTDSELGSEVLAPLAAERGEEPGEVSGEEKGWLLALRKLSGDEGGEWNDEEWLQGSGGGDLGLGGELGPVLIEALIGAEVEA